MRISDLKVYQKFLSRNKLYTLVSVIGFSVSLTFVILLSVYVRQELSVDSFHEKKDRIFLLSNEDYSSFANPVAPFIKDNFPEVESFTRFTSKKTAIGNKGTPKQAAKTLFADSTFFKIFSFKLIEGNRSQVLVARKSVVLTQSFANKIFKEQNPVGKTIFIDNEEHIVTGLAEDIPDNTIFRKADIIVTYSSLAQYYGEGVFTRWTWSNYGMFFLEKEGADLQSKSADILRLLKKGHSEDTSYYEELSFILLKDVYFSQIKGLDDLRTNSPTLITVYIAVTILILVIALLNYINMTIAQAGFRGKEAALRKLLGCSRKDLILQFLLESLLMTSFTFILALLMAFMVEPYFNNLLSTNLRLINEFTPLLVIIAILFILLISILAGLIPALVISRFNPIEVVKGSFTQKMKSKYSKLLIVFQYTVAIALLVCSFFIKQQSDFLVSYDTGFNRERILVMNNKLDISQLLAFKATLLTIQGVENVSYATGTPIDGIYHNLFERDGEKISYQYFAADTAFFSIFGIKVVPINTPTANYSFWLNQKAYDLLTDSATNMANVGYRENVQVLGIISDFRAGSLHQIDNLIAVELLGDKQKPYDIIVKIGDNANLLQTTDKIKKVYLEYNRGEIFETRFVDETIQKWYEKEQKTSQIILVFTILTIIIMVMGVFAMSLYLIQQKEKEIAIRKVSGATEGEILRMLNADSFIRVLIAFVLGCFIAYFAMSQWLDNFAYKIKLSWWGFVAAGAIVLLLSLLSISWQSLKAARANPIDSIKGE
ncbi:ABC transporter permease [Dysgonomonas sp. GY617]|uniref:ABC transporter permease n=1 Tax=Dysgonomonas sp. GY617 TaxID=2780420 RepID=UPI0018847014|nr:ABC transporter permease [Dysgonomonas sp. GY617]MBF0575122.1 FtsX-like permease family protein [Dysgonomonas sp. GY617]